MRDKFFLLLGIVIIVWSFYAFFNKPAPEKYQSYSIPPFVLEIADTDAKRLRGLSGRESLPDGTGLLFVFDEPGLHGFWMKNMNFPIDIVWLDDGFGIIAVEKNVSPGTYPQVFYPPRAVKYVLELNAGESLMLEFRE